MKYTNQRNETRRNPLKNNVDEIYFHHTQGKHNLQKAAHGYQLPINIFLVIAK